jgi:hypothetical protein
VCEATNLHSARAGRPKNTKAVYIAPALEGNNTPRSYLPAIPTFRTPAISNYQGSLFGQMITRARAQRIHKR